MHTYCSKTILNVYWCADKNTSELCMLREDFEKKINSRLQWSRAHLVHSDTPLFAYWLGFQRSHSSQILCRLELSICSTMCVCVCVCVCVCLLYTVCIQCTENNVLIAIYTYCNQSLSTENNIYYP
jgi:hypothetical protein